MHASKRWVGRAMALLLLVAPVAAAGPARGIKDDLRAGPAANASEIPALAQLLDKAGWQPTPELSGVYRTGSLFEATEEGHRLMVRDCFAAEVVEDTYTATEVVTELQAGVRMRFGGGQAAAQGELVKKVRFGSPLHTTIERLAMRPTEACLAMLEDVPAQTRARMYAVQEVLSAEILEQTCGRIDASGSFVGLGSAEAELARACVQESLEPVAVGYRVVPLDELVGGGGLVQISVPSGCTLAPVQSAWATMTRVSVNGTTWKVRGRDARAAFAGELQACGYDEAADAFRRWRAARRATNAFCATLSGCYFAWIPGRTAAKRRVDMELALLEGR